jgi:hypothetical protein
MTKQNGKGWQSYVKFYIEKAMNPTSETTRSRYLISFRDVFSSFGTQLYGERVRDVKAVNSNA